MGMVSGPLGIRHALKVKKEKKRKQEDEKKCRSEQKIRIEKVQNEDNEQMMRKARRRN